MLLELNLRNFKTFNKGDFTFAPGLNFIQGINGTGKSTIVEAIVFAMFGPRALKVDRENTIRTGAVGDATVSLTGELFSDEFTVKRHLSGAVQLKTSAGVETKRALEVTKYFSSVFIDLKTFLSTCACYQKDVDRLASQGAADRRDFISRLLCLDVVKDCVDTLGGELKNLREVDLGQLKRIIKDLEATKKVVIGMNLETVNQAYNLLQELKRSEGKDPEKASKKLQRITKKIQQLEGERGTTLVFRKIFEAVLQGDLQECPICHTDIPLGEGSDIREHFKTRLQKVLVEESDTLSKLSKHRTEMVDLQAIANLRPPNDIKHQLDATGISSPEDAFENLRQYETLRSQLSLLQGDLPAHKLHKSKTTLRQLFRDFREYVLVPYFGVINFTVSEYLTTNTQFSKFVLKEDLSVYVDDRPLETYSGGETDLICTLFRLAAARVLAELRYGNLPFLLLDSFADSLDDNNFSLIAGFLQTQLPNVDQVILTAHHNVSIPGAYRINL